ncbi:hypothetical protein [uncultured Algibacter sp.]|uniref:hypothetical protein n=1 Tax=uncultured Algibacter sp. TaxID=298659 RepID=UPI003217DB97
MKTKIPYSVILLLLLVFTMISCEDIKKDDDTGNHQDYVKAPDKIIPIKSGINLFNSYKRKRSDVIEPILRDSFGLKGFQDTKFVWHSLEDIKEYIAYIEKVQKTNPQYEVTGLRFYFGAYSEGFQSEKYPNQQTFFMVPTTKSSKHDGRHNNMNHIPFSILPDSEKNPIKGKFIAIHDLMLDYNKKERLEPYYNPKEQKGSFSLNTANLMTTSFLEETSLIHNEGEMSPPPE